jgi:hypothetical protein
MMTLLLFMPLSQALHALADQIDYDRDGAVSWPELLNWLAFDDRVCRTVATRLRLGVARAVATGATELSLFHAKIEEVKKRFPGGSVSVEQVQHLLLDVTGVELTSREASSLVLFLNSQDGLRRSKSDSAEPSPLSAAVLCDFLVVHLDDVLEHEAIDVS